ncbi:MAG: F0F1 ATP synthase subunit delta [bacterium]
MTNTEVAQAIYLATKDKKGAELESALESATKFLSRKRLLSKTSEILNTLEEIVNKAEGRIAVNLKSAQKLKEETKKEIAQMLKKHYDAKEFAFVETIEPKVLGGVRIEVGNDVIDLSVKNKIGQLKNYLQRV